MFYVVIYVVWIFKQICNPTLLIVESGAQDRRRLSLFLFRSSSCDDVSNRNCMPIGKFSL
jgi:hypothetical protein